MKKGIQLSKARCYTAIWCEQKLNILFSIYSSQIDRCNWSTSMSMNRWRDIALGKIFLFFNVRFFFSYRSITKYLPLFLVLKTRKRVVVGMLHNFFRLILARFFGVFLLLSTSAEKKKKKHAALSASQPSLCCATQHRFDVAFIYTVLAAFFFFSHHPRVPSGALWGFVDFRSPSLSIPLDRSLPSVRFLLKHLSMPTSCCISCRLITIAADVEEVLQSLRTFSCFYRLPNTLDLQL